MGFTSRSPTMDPTVATMIRVTGSVENRPLSMPQKRSSPMLAWASHAPPRPPTPSNRSIEHLFIITGLLLVMSIGLGVVGLLGLVEAMSTAVAERRGEIALMQDRWAPRPAQIIRMVVTEAITVIALAVAGGIALAAVLTLARRERCRRDLRGRPTALHVVAARRWASPPSSWRPPASPPASSRPTRLRICQCEKPSRAAETPTPQRKETPCQKEPNAPSGA